MKSILLLLLTLFSLTAAAQDADCEKFRTGNFKYEDPNYGVIRVKRTETAQVEINADKIEIHSTVKWVSDCKFVLTHEKIVGADIPEIIGKKVYVEIIESKDNSYTCKATTEEGFGGTIEVVKVK
jgi:hypothetical protein